MPASASPDPRVTAPDSGPAIVAKLRSAGCVFAEDEAQLLISAAATPASLSAMVDRRAAGEPLEHVLGWAEFCGLRIAVGPGVFIPRRRTELLVREAAAVARQPGPVVVVDLCCGSGAVGAALAAALGGVAGPGLALGGAAGPGPTERRVELHAADLDPAAVWCARRNVAAAGGRVYQGDLYEPLPAALQSRVDILLANAPYVPTEEVALLPAEARVHEPLLALDGGADGLDILRRVAAGAPRWLAPGGHLLVETSERQAPQITEAVARAGLAPRLARSEELNATAVIAARPAPGNGPGGG
jgi:release factor glutamine methyltransferase